MNRNFKMLIKSEGNGVRLEVEGTKYSLMYALAHLASNLLEKSNLSREDIRKAVEIGLMSKEEIQKEIEQKREKVEQELKELFKRIF